MRAAENHQRKKSSSYCQDDQET